MKTKPEINYGYRFFLLITILLLAIMPAALIAQDSESEEDVDPEEQLEENLEQQAVLERDLSALHQAENFAENELEGIDRELTNISRQIERTTTTLETKQQQVDFYNSSNTQAIEDLEAAVGELPQRLRDALAEQIESAPEGKKPLIGERMKDYLTQVAASSTAGTLIMALKAWLEL